MKVYFQDFQLCKSCFQVEVLGDGKHQTHQYAFYFGRRLVFIRSAEVHNLHIQPLLALRVYSARSTVSCNLESDGEQQTSRNSIYLMSDAGGPLPY